MCIGCVVSRTSTYSSVWVMERQATTGSFACSGRQDEWMTHTVQHWHKAQRKIQMITKSTDGDAATEDTVTNLQQYPPPPPPPKRKKTPHETYPLNIKKDIRAWEYRGVLEYSTIRMVHSYLNNSTDVTSRKGVVVQNANTQSYRDVVWQLSSLSLLWHRCGLSHLPKLHGKSSPFFLEQTMEANSTDCLHSNTQPVQNCKA